jgi:hypothetical protein
MNQAFKQPMQKTIRKTIREQSKPNRVIIGFHSLVAVLLTFAICSMASVVCAATPPAPDKVLSAVGIGTDDVKRLMTGEILSYSTTEPTDKALSNGLIMFVKTAPNRLVNAIRRGALLAKDPNVLAYGEITLGAGIGAFKRFTYSDRQADEVENLLEVEAGSEFNLSLQEIASFQALAKSLDAKQTDAVAKAVAQQYRTILLKRVQAYQKAGLNGIAPYARGGGKVTDAGAELRIFTLQNKLLKLFAPVLQEALLRYPAKLPPATTSRFLWINRRVQSRPTAILNHRLIHTLDDTAIIVQNEYYAGHSFNVGQLVIGSVPYQNGTLVVYMHRTSTDQVAGIGQSLKHSIGREDLKKEMIKRFQRLKASLSKA